MRPDCLLSGHPIGLVECGQSVVMVTRFLHRLSQAWAVVTIHSVLQVGLHFLKPILIMSDIFSKQEYTCDVLSNMLGILARNFMKWMPRLFWNPSQLHLRGIRRIKKFKARKFKGTFFFFFNLPGSFPSGPEQKERTAWIFFTKHIIYVFRRTCQTAF